METITHECYVSLEVAKLLKQAGFNWFIRGAYRDAVFVFQENSLCDNFNGKQYENGTIHEFFSAPTLAVAQRWLREVKGCAVIVETHNVQAACVSAYVYCIYPTDATHPCEHINGFAEDQCFDTYEQALEAGIKKALEIILEKGE